MKSVLFEFYVIFALYEHYVFQIYKNLLVRISFENVDD